MSDDQREPIDNDSEESFYNEEKSEQSQQKMERDDGQKILSKSDAFKSKKGKKIKKRQRGHRKPKSSKQEERQRRILELAQQQAETIIQEMQKRYDEDRKLYQKKKPANKKLTYLSQLAQKLINITVWEKFLQLGGLRQFQLWFTKLPEGIEPSLTLRKGLLNILNSLKIRSQYLSSVAQIQRIVQKHKKAQTKELRELSQSILLKWSKTMHEQENE